MACLHPSLTIVSNALAVNIGAGLVYDANGHVSVAPSALVKPEVHGGRTSRDSGLLGYPTAVPAYDSGPAWHSASVTTAAPSLLTVTYEFGITLSVTPGSNWSVLQKRNDGDFPFAGQAPESDVEHEITVACSSVLQQLTTAGSTTVIGGGIHVNATGVIEVKNFAIAISYTTISI